MLLFKSSYPISLIPSDGIPAGAVLGLAEFVRVVTHPKLDNAFGAAKARAAFEALLASPSLELLSAAERFVPRFEEALVEGKPVGNVDFDAQIVALCREAGGTGAAHGASHREEGGWDPAQARRAV